MSELIVLLNGREAGHLVQKRGRVTFTYSESWRCSLGAYPLSVSMPLQMAEHPHSVIEPFLWGLVPDNEFVLKRWGRRFHVSPRNAFSLLECVGEAMIGKAVEAAVDSQIMAEFAKQRRALSIHPSKKC